MSVLARDSRRDAPALPLTRVDVSRYTLHNPFVQAMINAGFKIDDQGRRVYLVKAARPLSRLRQWVARRFGL